MKLLETVIRKNGCIRFVGNSQNESIATTNSASRWCNEFIVLDCLFKLGNFFFRDAMPKSCIDDHRHLDAFVLVHQGHHSFMELLKAGRGAALGRNIRPVDDDVLSHPFSQALRDHFIGAIRPILTQ